MATTHHAPDPFVMHVAVAPAAGRDGLYFSIKGSSVAFLKDVLKTFQVNVLCAAGSITQR